MKKSRGISPDLEVLHYSVETHWKIEEMIEPVLGFIHLHGSDKKPYIFLLTFPYDLASQRNHTGYTIELPERFVDEVAKLSFNRLML